jgi:hypothetical protein
MLCGTMLSQDRSAPMACSGYDDFAMTSPISIDSSGEMIDFLEVQHRTVGWTGVVDVER